MTNSKNLKIGSAGREQDGRCHLVKPSKGFKLAIYEPILMKLESQVPNGMPNLKISNAEVLAGNKMAAAAILEKHKVL